MKNRVTFEIVDISKYVRVDDVITEGLKGIEGRYFGTLIINLRHEGRVISMPVDGWFDQNDYVEEYGFRLIDLQDWRS